jgi:hypothetical protein
MAFVSPGERTLEQWALAALVYAARPKASTWSLVEPDPSGWQPPSEEGWAEAAPGLAWAEGEEQ